MATAADVRSDAQPRKGRPRGRYAKSDEIREAILDAALGVFAEGGFRAGSLRLVAERAGMSEAGLLHHFPRKSVLLEAVLERRDRLAHAFVPLEVVNGEDAIRGLVELARYNASIPGLVELYCTIAGEATSPDHPAHDRYVRRYEVVRGTLLEAFTDLATKGMLRDGVTPSGAAKATIAIMDGLQIQWLLDPLVMDMAEDLRAFLTLLTTVRL
jgi:AcrR family transcriptional regulator